MKKLKKPRNAEKESHHEHEQEPEEEEEGTDRLSALPDSLLLEIISRCDISEAARTSELSHRWRHLWTHLSLFTYSCHKIDPTILRILHKLAYPNLRSFYLSCCQYDGVLSKSAKQQRLSVLLSCFRLVCSRNVQDIEVHIGLCNALLDFSVFQCQSLVNLHLFGFRNFELQTVITLPNLKNLSLDLKCTSPEVVGKIIKSCPLLEDLRLWFSPYYQDPHFVDILAPKLKFLFIEGFCVHTKFVIDAPNLVEISLEGYCENYLFVGKPRALVKAKVALYDFMKLDDGQLNYLTQLSKFLQAISCVKYLDLHNRNGFVDECVEYNLRDEINRVFPIFYNLTHLRLTFRSLRSWKDVLLWESLFPKLESLQLHDSDSCSMFSQAYPKLYSADFMHDHCFSKLKKLEITGFVGPDVQTGLLKGILSETRVLDQLIVCVRHSRASSEKQWLRREYKLCTALFKLPRTSLSCEIVFIGEFVNTSSKSFEEGRLPCEILITQKHIQTQSFQQWPRS